MEKHWLKREGNPSLILFVLGWAADSRVVEYIRPEGYDMLCLYDYRTIEPVAQEELAEYRSVHLFAWSFGVWVAEQVLRGIPLAQAVALNGTPRPVDDRYGIPSRAFRVTLRGIAAAGTDAFNRRAYGEYYDTAGSLTPSRTAEELHEELATLYEMSAQDSALAQGGGDMGQDTALAQRCGDTDRDTASVQGQKQGQKQRGGEVRDMVSVLLHGEAPESPFPLPSVTPELSSPLPSVAPEAPFPLSSASPVVWNRAVIGSRDMIFPPANMKRYWGNLAVEVDLPHYPFGQAEIITELLDNTWPKPPRGFASPAPGQVTNPDPKRVTPRPPHSKKEKSHDNR